MSQKTKTASRNPTVDAGVVKDGLGVSRYFQTKIGDVGNPRFDKLIFDFVGRNNALALFDLCKPVKFLIGEIRHFSHDRLHGDGLIIAQQCRARAFR